MNIQQILYMIIDHARGMWRFRWYVVGVAWIVAILGWTFVARMPNTYMASAKVLVDTNSLLPDLTRGLTANENLMDEVALVSKALLSRPNLEKVALDTDLSLRANTPQEMENLISGLQRSVKVRGGGRNNIFSISYEDRSRQKATDVVATLLNTFVESSLGAQGDDADMTERALRLEIDDHEERLIKAEAELAEFKKKNLGYMPGDGSDYYTRLQAAISAVEDVDMQIALLRQRREEIARQLQGEQPLLSAATTSSAYAMSGCSKAATLEQLQAQLSALQVDFTDKHPRIVMLRETIATLTEQCREELAALGGNEPVRNLETQALEANPIYQNLRMQLSDADVELAALQAERVTKLREVAELRADVDKIADVETELKKLNRDYGVIEGRHQELLRRWETLQSKKRIDPVTDTVRFNIVEPPFASTEPVSPDRPLLMTAVLVLALGAGGAVAFLLNQLKPVFFNRRTLSRVAGLPVLGNVSLIMSRVEARSRRRGTVAWVGANVVLLGIAGAVILFDDSISLIIREITGSNF